jgi:hypothetical protein
LAVSRRRALDLRRNQHGGRECAELERRQAVILSYTSWGDRVRYYLDACGRVGLPRPAGWLREDEPAFRLSQELAA